MSPHLPFALALFAVVLCSPIAAAHEDPLFNAEREPPFATPLLSGLAGYSSETFDSQGITLMGWISLGEFGRHLTASDCWGYVSPSGREYAIIGLRFGVGFVEITDPGRPEIVTVLPAIGSLWRDIKVYQSYAYYVSEGGDGIQVADLSQIDSGIVTLVNTVDTPGTSDTHNLVIDETSGFLYRTGGGSDRTGLRIYSLANPASPTYVNSWNNRYVHDAQVVTYTSGPYNGRQIAFCFSESGAGGGSPGLDILDVTNKSNIQSLSRYFYSLNQYSHQGWLSPDRNYLYLNDEKDERTYGTTTTTRVINVSNLNSPAQVSTFTSGSTAIDHNLYTLGNKIYEANYRSGVRVFDASDPVNPVQVAWFDTFPRNDAPQFNGLWSVYPYFPSGTIIGSDLERGLFIWREHPDEISIDMPNGNPELINPAGFTFAVQISEATPGLLVAGSEQLHFDTGSGFSSVALVNLGSGNYEAQFPAIACGTPVTYYISARTTTGVTWNEPPAAPTILYLTTPALDKTLLIENDMESGQGWIAGAPGDSATGGVWVRRNPNGTIAQTGFDHTDDPGVVCWVTGNGILTGSSFMNEADVDNGVTTLTTSPIDLSLGDASISYWRWYSNFLGNNRNEDVFEIDISNNGGATWTNVETIGPGGPGPMGGWLYHQFTVSDFVVPTQQILVRFVASDLLGPSTVEAAIDDFAVTRYSCHPTCQTDLGFGGPGGAQVSICGDGLGSGQQSTVLLLNAPQSAIAILFLGLTNQPTPVRGGMLVPTPYLAAVPFSTDAFGRIEFSLSGGGGPATWYAQFAIVDPTQPLGAAFSNALEALLGP